MIYLEEKSSDQAGFRNLLELTKDKLKVQLKTVDNPSFLSGAEFELMTFENSVLSAKETPFEGKLRHTDDREFPDIIAADLFGVEVKATKKDDWTSIGNSVLESSRVSGVEKIYMFFGKLGGEPDIMYRNYEDCLKGIAVTHYPRYQIDMLLKDNDSIFKKMDTSYENIRNSKNPVKEIRKYYKKQLKEGDALWWIDDDLEKTSSLSPIIKNFSSLEADIRDNIKADILVLFPEIFSNNNKKYEKIPAYLAANYGVVSANLRDHFTAGGQVTLKYDRKTFQVPQIIGELHRLSKKVEKHLAESELSLLSNFWQKHIEGHEDAKSAWLAEIDKQSSALDLKIKLSKLYRLALNDKLRI